MVVALAFGVLFDFFLTLMLVPAMYGIGVDITRFFRGLWRGEKDIIQDTETSVATPAPAE